MLKKIINFIVSVSLIYTQSVTVVSFASIKVYADTSSIVVAPGDSASPGENTPPVQSEPINSDSNTTINAQCLIYFDTLKNNECNQYWKSVGSNDISDLQAQDPVMFQNCLSTNCGSYPTNGVPEEQTYPYIMESIKGCTLDSDKTLNGSEVAKSSWFYNNKYSDVNDSANLNDLNQSQIKIIPFRLLQYACPSYSENTCVSYERSLQSPVMCFKNDTPAALKQTIQSCLSGNDDDCKTANNSGGIGNYIFWQYCDEDRDGDGFYESLSPQAQEACNRSDAATLTCARDQACTIIASCADDQNITKNISSRRVCKDVSRKYEEHILNTACGDQTDIYKENPDCVLINSLDDAMQDSNITLGFASGAGNRTDDYTELVLYRKKANFQHQALLAAIFFPFSLDKTQKGYYLFGINVSSIAKLFGATLKWESDGMATILDDLYNKTMQYCKNTENLPAGNTQSGLTALPACDACQELAANACKDKKDSPIMYRICLNNHQSDINNCLSQNNCPGPDDSSGGIDGEAGGSQCTVKHKQDIRSWTWTSGHIIKRKYRRTVVQTAIWTEPFITNMDIRDFEWVPGYGHLNWIPTRIDYTMKAHMKQNDILVLYNTNTRPDYESYIETKINTYTGTQTCGTANNVVYNSYKNLTNAVDPIVAPDIDIHDVAMILPHAGLYTVELYDNDQFINSFVTYFPLNDGTNYPMTSQNMLDLDFDYSQFTQDINSSIQNKIPTLVENKLKTTEIQTNINNATNDILNILIEANKYRLDYNQHIDYLDDLENSNASSLYTLLEEDLYEEKLQNNTLAPSNTSTDPDFSNYPAKINANKILDYELIKTDSSLDNTANTSQNYAIARLGDIDYQRTQSGFLNTMRQRLSSFLTPLDDSRFNSLIGYTNDVYSDFQEVKDTVSSYLNKSGSRYSTSTSYGSYSASFKSTCGDYQDALNGLDANYDATKSTVGGNYFQSDLNTIKSSTENIVNGHLKNQTVTYKYYTNTRTGTTDYDDRHSAVVGSYSCNYDSTCYDSCASTYDCNCNTTCDENGKNCSTSCDSCCQGGYVPCTKTESGSCTTYGNTGSNCTAQCNGYHKAYYGSSYDDNGDVSNDWDNSCTGNYRWYTTNDNGGVGGSKTISGTSSGHFSSWGSYSCDDFSLTPTGTSTTKCIYNKHDQSDDYTNTEPASSSSWSSTSKKLDTDTDSVDTELNTWMKNNNYKDSTDLSPYFSGVDNVRYHLAYDDSNGINLTANSDVLGSIRTAVTQLYRDYLLKHYQNLLDKQAFDVDPDLHDLIENEYKTAYANYVDENWKPFNRIIIRDGEISADNNNSVNFDITLPGGHYVRNPQSFSITIAPHNEQRKYRCYTDWNNCDVPDNCTLDSEDITNRITDADHKNVPILKNMNFICNSEKSIDSCGSYQFTKQCTDLNLSTGIVDYDDNDFSKDFYSGINKAMAINNSIKIFGGENLRCEHGLFVDFSWAQDPFFWLSAINAFGSLNKGFSAMKQGMSAWMKSAVPGLNFLTKTGECARTFASCLGNSGYGPVGTITQMFTGGNDDYTPKGFSNTQDNCLNQVRGTDAVGRQGGCLGWASDFQSESGMLSKIQNALTKQFDGIAKQFGLADGKELFGTYGPMIALAAQVVMNLALNTFDRCSQCTDHKCAESHDPKEAVRLLKLSNAMNNGTKFTGAEYGLGDGFTAYDNCFYVKDDCAGKFLGHCIRHASHFCCYNSRLSRLLVGQIYQQLGYTFQQDGCNAISLSDLSRIDFSNCASNVIPSPSNKCINYSEMKDYILNQVNWNTQKSFDMNTAIQSVINSTKLME